MVSGNALLTLAIQLALVGHDGQSRKGEGEPYFNHVDRVARRVSPLGWRAQTVAYLHDLVEDTPVTGFTLEQVGFPLHIVGDVIALSRVDGETYAEFIDRAIKHSARIGLTDVLQVKLADLHDNLTDPWLVDKPGKRSRYVRADSAVRVALLERGVEPLVFGS
jgi:(p)ppGpp synthase/HD superfamily hydrolase